MLTYDTLRSEADHQRRDLEHEGSIQRLALEARSRRRRRARPRLLPMLGRLLAEHRHAVSH